MTESARRLEAAHGVGKPHLWHHAGMWARTLGPLSVVRCDPCAAVRDLRDLLARVRMDALRQRWGRP